MLITTVNVLHFDSENSQKQLPRKLYIAYNNFSSEADLDGVEGSSCKFRFNLLS